MAKFNFKKGDMVEIIAGDDKGTKATVLAVMPKKNKVIVEGCKVAKKAVKPTEENTKGGHINKEMPIDVSNVRKVEA
ncbi:50S ribosomal protein L24 [Sulfurimonas paralvinellae]|jgi:large subunit ribosomal protein L24|uniref:Large ribosomal subunit protein uL24 n=1 Tax=Sulfurimonas paralvinellae TaxID=317658 RepID=A0A7M1B5D3_9BACT|nr:50S ribosomal protein L24 [Sulfurimonas paralvinellae]QOP44934.1 50S ribosomal protein L24 [Sulfurimonas paralvinellae]